MQLTPLKAGDRAEGFGSIVCLVDGFGLLYEGPGGDGFPPQEVYLATYSVARLHLVDGGRFLGRHCTVSGRWTGSALEVDEIGPMPPQVEPAPSWKGPHIDRPLRPRVSAPTPNETTWVGLPLSEAGILLSHGIDEHGYAHVVTHDLERTEAALRPLYGDSLLLTASPWPPEVFDQIQQLVKIGDEQEIGFISGGGFGYEAEYDGYFVVTYVTDELAAVARDIPSAALRVETLLRPIDINVVENNVVER